MKAIRLHRSGLLQIHEEPIPEKKVGESLIRVSAVGICGSDLHWYEEGTTGVGEITAPFILGHEFSGVVVEGELHGHRVAVDPQVPCGSCEYCLEGNPNLCPYHYFAGQSPQDGGLQEFISWPTRNLHVIPESMSFAEGAMLEPLGVALHTVDLGKLKPGMMVGVYGCGPIGLLIVQVARVAGATRIFVTDKLQHRLEAAVQFGASDPVIAGSGVDSDEILELTNGRGVDVAFEAAGENEAVETAVETCKPGGRVVLCGIPSNDRTSLSASVTRRKGLTLMAVRRMKHTYPRAIALLENRSVDVSSIVTHRFPLADYERAFVSANKREGLKVIIEVDQSS